MYYEKDYYAKVPKEVRRRKIAARAGYYKSNMEYHNKKIYEHMELQAAGVKYKPRFKDVTYHGRKAIQHIYSYIYDYEQYIYNITRLEELYA